jgi:hypothetical protein
MEGHQGFFVDLLHALAELYALRGRATDARELDAKARTGYEALVQRYPDAMYWHASEFYSATGDKAKALDLLQKNATLLPNSTSFVALARAELASGRRTEARVSIDKALAMPLVSASLFHTASRVYEGAAADQFLARATARNPPHRGGRRALIRRRPAVPWHTPPPPRRTTSPGCERIDHTSDHAPDHIILHHEGGAPCPGGPDFTRFRGPVMAVNAARPVLDRGARVSVGAHGMSTEGKGAIMKSAGVVGLVGLGLSVLIGCGGSGGDDTQSGNGALSAGGSSQPPAAAPAAAKQPGAPAAAAAEPAGTVATADVSALWDAMLKAYKSVGTVRAFRDIQIGDGFTADEFSDFQNRSAKAVSVANSQFTPPLDMDLRLQQLWNVGIDEDNPEPEVLALGSLLDAQHIDRKIVLDTTEREGAQVALLFATSTMLVGMCMLTTNTDELEACHVVGQNLPPDAPPSGPPGEDAQ